MARIYFLKIFSKMFGIYKNNIYICNEFNWLTMKNSLNFGRPQQHPQMDEWGNYV